ncbi:HAD family phosphatase [Vibrio sp. JPW-9-11-11]|uniref:HAD family hydrolase n=1 Tax=Vibrio sp. JPW-9-11-11 TaxID=1416532 RepID=UPI00159469EE|nr:HAD family phosphatase [Vibrio sp. JPW-9-11-11]NVD07729.1 HAD family phosphatase [Vibrio sp. JPW-9-11-11]
MKFQAAIFDMDGLLLDTERLCMHVFKQACQTVNVPFYEDIYLSIIGRNSAGIEPIFRRAYGENYERLHQEWRTQYDSVVKHQAIPVKEGVVALLEWLNAKQIPVAVATSTHREVAQVKLELANLSQYFTNLTCGCEVSHGKPHPEIYLLAASRLGVDPQQCIAFEDSNNGVRSAVAANMTTFQVPDLVEPSDEVKALGHHIVPSLNHALSYLKSHP